MAQETISRWIACLTTVWEIAAPETERVYTAQTNKYAEKIKAKRLTHSVWESLEDPLRIPRKTTGENQGDPWKSPGNPRRRPGNPSGVPGEALGDPQGKARESAGFPREIPVENQGIPGKP